MINEIELDGQFDRLGLEEGMKITDISPTREAFDKGEACSFTAKCGDDFVCRFCWPSLQKEMKACWISKDRRRREKIMALKTKQQREAKAKAIQEEIARKNKHKEAQFPATFLTLRLAQVRKAFSLESEKVTELKRHTPVEVAEVEGNRARITIPVEGWMSIVTKNGLLLDLCTQSVRAFPALGATEVYKEATVAYKKPKTLKEVALNTTKLPNGKKKFDWDCRVCGAKGCFASRQYCYRCKAPRSKSVALEKKPTQNTPVDARSLKSSSTAISASGVMQSAPSSDSGSSSCSAPVPPPIVVKRGRTYLTLRAAVVRKEVSKKSKQIARLEENQKVYVDLVDHKNLRARISSPVRGWISTWTRNGRLLK